MGGRNEKKTKKNCMSFFDVQNVDVYEDHCLWSKESVFPKTLYTVQPKLERLSMEVHTLCIYGGI